MGLGGTDYKLNMISYLNWALNLAKSSWSELLNEWKRQHDELCVQLCLFHIFGQRLDSLGRRKCIFTHNKFYRKNERGSGIRKEGNLAAIESEEGLSWPLRGAMKLRWLSETPQVGERCWDLVCWHWWVLGYVVPWEGDVHWERDFSAGTTPGKASRQPS